ncbi:hypothetical protein GWI33_001613 [Rhynchophorus ferrugineus]|uniref:Uncharacterized protein n=1 Tax=Rhynchophorus ferrugineus TaxID=354439 RepID=A0A834ILH3_RHYFE|nr:hypothetical protein GWI33_001613 [Rhynchophorus ferrugineus]
MYLGNINATERENGTVGVNGRPGRRGAPGGRWSKEQWERAPDYPTSWSCLIDGAAHGLCHVSIYQGDDGISSRKKKLHATCKN